MVDRYGDYIVSEYYSLAMFRQAERLERLWAAHYPGAKFVRRASDHTQSMEGFTIPPQPPTVTRIKEYGVTFEVNLTGGHKTGFFCDQRDNRLRFSRLVKGARVLDLCCYTGGFSLAATVLGGAADATGVDLDETAVAQALRNQNLNQVPPARLHWVHADAFAYARQMQQNGEQWDAVVVDPPKFVLTREGEGHWEGRRKYEDLNQLAISLVKPGGLLVTCSCSGLVSLEEFETHVIKAAHRLNRRLQFFEQTGPGPDHPVQSNCLESRYLKVLWARVV